MNRIGRNWSVWRIYPDPFPVLCVSRCGLAVRRYAGEQKDPGSIRFGSPFSSKIVVDGRRLVTLPTQLMKH